MLRAIFYARFHPARGPSVVHQYPPHSIISSSPGGGGKPLINFSDISSYVIPPYEVCNRPLAFLSADGGFRVLGVPVSIESAKYSRNRFTYNVCFVFDADVDTRPWERIVRKTARFFRDVEECDGLLQAEELLPGLLWAGDVKYLASPIGMVFPLLRRLFTDLNKYGETSVAVDSNSMHIFNLRLVPPRPRTASIKAWHVPLIVRTWSSDKQLTCDPTLQRIHSHINGINSVQRIAERADVELKLVKKAHRELLRHQRILLTNIFHSQAIYTSTDNFAWFVQDEDMLDECITYISQSSSPLSHATIINLYRQLGPGISVQDFCLTFSHELAGIDVRRFVTFGVLKGFLRRLHKYAISVESQPSTPKISNGSAPTKTPPSTLSPEKAWKTAALSSGWPNPQMVEYFATNNAAGVVDQDDSDVRLAGFLDGNHCLDEICLALKLGEKRVVDMLMGGKYGEVLFVCR